MSFGIKPYRISMIVGLDENVVVGFHVFKIWYASVMANDFSSIITPSERHLHVYICYTHYLSTLRSFWHRCLPTDILFLNFIFFFCGPFLFSFLISYWSALVDYMPNIVYYIKSLLYIVLFVILIFKLFLSFDIIYGNNSYIQSM